MMEISRHANITMNIIIWELTRRVNLDWEDPRLSGVVSWSSGVWLTLNCKDNLRGVLVVLYEVSCKKRKVPAVVKIVTSALPLSYNQPLYHQHVFTSDLYFWPRLFNFIAYCGPEVHCYIHQTLMLHFCPSQAFLRHTITWTQIQNLPTVSL